MPGSKPGERRGGRQKGTPNKRTLARKEAMQAQAAALAGGLGPDAFQGDAHAFLMLVYKDPNMPLSDRLDAAKAAVRFEKPALAATDMTTKGERLGYVIAAPPEATDADEWAKQHQPPH